MEITLIATTIMGLESVLAHEIKALGFKQVRVFDYKVEFDCQIKDICVAIPIAKPPATLPPTTLPIFVACRLI